MDEIDEETFSYYSDQDGIDDTDKSEGEVWLFFNFLERGKSELKT